MQEERKKMILWISGTKGGCGKSMMAALAVDYYHDRGHTPIIVEADGSVPDVGRRYDGIVPGVLSPIGGTDPADEIYSLLEKIEQADPSADRIIINLPGNTSVVEAAAQEIQGVAEPLGFECATIFMIAENEDSPALCQQSLESGLCSISSRKAAVVNGRFGREMEKFAWYASAPRRRWLEEGLPEAFLPELHDRVRELPQFQRGFLSTLASPGDHGLTLINQMLVRRFVSAGFAVCDLIEGDQEE